jgi:hypothetical protein
MADLSDNEIVAKIGRPSVVVVQMWAARAWHQFRREKKPLCAQFFLLSGIALADFGSSTNLFEASTQTRTNLAGYSSFFRMSFVPIRKENMKTIAFAVAMARVEFIVLPQSALRVGLCECLCSSMTFQSCRRRDRLSI